METPEISLEDAIRHLYATAVGSGSATSTLRLRDLARYCVQQLSARGLLGTETEVPIPGGGRPKQWDVAWKYQAKYRMAVSLKSILRNLSGTVPNRIDDLMGEVTNVQMYSPEMVTGYLMVFDISRDLESHRHGTTWCELLRHRLTSLSGRSAPAWSTGMIEAFAIIQVDFSQGGRLVTDESQVHAMLDTLVS